MKGPGKAFEIFEEGKEVKRNKSQGTESGEQGQDLSFKKKKG